MNCLNLSSSTIRHQDVMCKIWEWFESNTDTRIVQRIKRVFVEAEFQQEFGSFFNNMNTYFQDRNG